MTTLATLRPPARRARVAATAALLAGLGVATLAGCGTGADSPTSSAPSGTASATPTPSAGDRASARPSRAAGGTGAPTTTGGSSAGSGSSGSPSTPVCSASDLRVSVQEPAGDGGGTAGGTYTVLGFENTSSSTCTVDGHPGVSFVGGGSGTQLGRAADFLGPTTRVRLQPGDAADAQLRIASPGPYGDDCAPVAADGFRVYPPDSRASVFVQSSSFQACSKDLPEGRSQLSVTAVGTTG